jgi:site-specific recombinase XerD
LLFYLDQHRCGGEGGDAEEEHLFLTETYHSLTKNALTLLFARLRIRAGLTERSISPSLLRDTYAVRYLQAGGDRKELGDRLGLRDLAALKRYEGLSARSSETKSPKEPAEVQKSIGKTGSQKSRRRRASAKKRTHNL